jgi:TolA-binding protein
MTPASGESKGAKVLAILTDLARRSVQPATPVQLDQGLHAVAARIAVGRARRRGLVRWSLAGTMAAAAVVGVLQIVSFSRARLLAPTSPALAYQIEGGRVVDGGYLRESGNGGIKLFFTEGTEFILMPGTRGRLGAIDSSGARIAIEHGTASFQVTPRSDGKWLVDVGPFLVTVKGTVFTVSWDATSERFELRLRHGQVTVTGPVAGGDIALRAGQRLVVNLPKAEILITEQKLEEAWADSTAGPAMPAAEAPRERPSAAPERPAAKTSTGASLPPVAAKVDGEHRWSAALAAGNLDLILADVDRAGVKSTLEKASSEDLFALADAARYRRRMALAREALLVERRRFPGSARSLDAAFLLGRVEEASERGMARAIEWYDEYLAQAPTGTYASEALGRKMTLTSQLKGAAQAQPVAEEYLRRFPNGTYAGSARALRRAP